LICYVDSSALVKRYLSEPGSSEVRRLLAEAELVGTATISRTEVVAALAKAVRLGILIREDGESVRQFFRVDWTDLLRLRITEQVIERSCDLAWAHGLRGYDAIQLAAAVTWQEALDSPVTLATFDVKLWATAELVGLTPYPQELPSLIESWKTGRSTG